MADAIGQMRAEIQRHQDEKARLEGEMASLAKRRPGLDKAVVETQAKLRAAKGPDPRLQAELRNARDAAQGAVAGIQSMRVKVAELTGKIAELEKNIKIVENFMRPKK